MSFQGGLRGCSEVLALRFCSISSSAWLPWRLFFEFSSKDFCPLILPRGQQQPVSRLFDWHTILFWLQRELCPCPESMLGPEVSALQRQEGQGSKGLGAGTASSPHPSPMPGAPASRSTLGSTALHTQTPVFPRKLRSLAFLEQQVSRYCAFCSSALPVKFIVVKRPEHTGRERQLPSISSLGEV